MASPAPKNQKNYNSLNLFLNNYFNVILALVLIVFLMGAYFLFLLPKYKATLGLIKDSISEEQKLLNAQKKKLADLKTVSDIYKKINPADLKKFNNVLSDNYVKESLFGEIEDIVNQNGFLINEIRISRPEEEITPGVATPKLAPLNSNLGEIDINLSVSAIDYAGFKNLVKIFESNLRLLDISSVSFSASGDTAELVLKTYYYQKNAK